MSNWKKWDENQLYNERTGDIIKIRNIHKTEWAVNFFGKRSMYKSFPTEQEAREFIEEFVGVSANGKLSDSKSEDQGSSPCAPDVSDYKDAFMRICDLQVPSNKLKPDYEAWCKQVGAI